LQQEHVDSVVEVATRSMPHLPAELDPDGVAEASDQYITSALITMPPDYQQHWSLYRL
jgi:hypothetical protein